MGLAMLSCNPWLRHLPRVFLIRILLLLLLLRILMLMFQLEDVRGIVPVLEPSAVGRVAVAATIIEMFRHRFFDCVRQCRDSPMLHDGRVATPVRRSKCEGRRLLRVGVFVSLSVSMCLLRFSCSLSLALSSFALSLTAFQGGNSTLKFGSRFGNPAFIAPSQICMGISATPVSGLAVAALSRKGWQTSRIR